jgi:hypothetical protein
MIVCFQLLARRDRLFNILIELLVSSPNGSEPNLS